MNQKPEQNHFPSDRVGGGGGEGGGRRRRSCENKPQ